MMHLLLAYPAETGFPGKDGDIMPQIGIDTFDREGVALVAAVSFVNTRINNINIAKPTISTVFLRIGRIIHYALNTLRRFVKISVKTKANRSTAEDTQRKMILRNIGKRQMFF